MECELKSKPNGLRSYGTEPADLLKGLSTFAHVLNISTTEEIVPSKAVSLFFREMFATRLISGDEEYVLDGAVWDHMRNEVLRQSGLPESDLPESIRVSELREPPRHDNPLSRQFPNQEAFASFVEDRLDEDDEEPDTLNSELLLTEVYRAPDACEEELFGPITSPHYPVGVSLPLAITSPTEQEDK